MAERPCRDRRHPDLQRRELPRATSSSSCRAAGLRRCVRGARHRLRVDGRDARDRAPLPRACVSIRSRTASSATAGPGTSPRELANGEFVAYLTHDAVPTSSDWLARADRAVRDRRADRRGASGKQVPRPARLPAAEVRDPGRVPGSRARLRHDRLLRRTLRAATTACSAPSASTPTSTPRLAGDFLARRDPVPRRALRGGSAVRTRPRVDAGYRKAYAPRAAVEHSNDLTLAEYGTRIFDETVGLRQIGFDSLRVTSDGQLRSRARGSLGDIAAHPPGSLLFSWKRKLVLARGESVRTRCASGQLPLRRRSSTSMTDGRRSPAGSTRAQPESAQPLVLIAEASTRGPGRRRPVCACAGAQRDGRAAVLGSAGRHCRSPSADVEAFRRAP